MVGDILDDVEAGKRAGCRTILVDLGTETLPAPAHRQPEYVAADSVQALRLIRSVERAPVTMTPTVPCMVRSAGSTTAAGPRGGVLAAGAVTAHDRAAAKTATTAELRRLSVNAMSVTPFVMEPSQRVV